MHMRKFLLGLATGFTAGYAAYRAVEALAALGRPVQQRPKDAAAYGSLRRALAVTGIARSIAGTSVLAYGAPGAALEKRVAGMPVWLQPMAFAAATTLLEAALELPVDFIEGYGIERRYDLTEQTPESWLSDALKQTVLGTALTTGLSGLLGAAFRKWPATWPYVASAAVFPLLVLANIVVPVFIMPMFNEYRPIEGPLEQRLRSLASRYGVGQAEILRMDMSKQTKKANAFVTGIFGTHRIVVGDTLIEHFPEDEIEFVVAHELGHYVAKDSWRLIGMGQIIAMLVLFGAFAAMRDAQDESHNAQPTKLARVQWWAVLFSQLVRPGLSAFARSREWAADRFALASTQTPHVGASAFRRLRDQNLAEDEQPAWFEFIFSTHPSLKARIAALEEAALN
jgi:STE24 endopeptidase